MTSSNKDDAAPNAPIQVSEPVRITGWASGGEGVGRFDDGRVVFVEGAVPGDLVEVAELESRKKMARGKVGRLLETSESRTEPECEHFGQCGGCVWQHVQYPVQLEAKREIVRNALARIGGVDYASEIEIEGSPAAYGYRARARVVESEGGVGYRMRGGRSVLRVSECPILLPSMQRSLADLTATRQSAAPIADEAATSNRRPRANEWILTAGSTGKAMFEQKAPSRGRSKAARPSGPSTESVLLEVLGEKLRARTASFVQANALLWDAFAKAVRDEALCTPVPKRFVELYAGIGFFTLPLARAGLRGVAIEGESSATTDLRFNLAENGLAEQVDVMTARVENRGDLAQHFARAELLVVDPPRTGLDRKVRDTIISSGPKRLVYVSCDAGTWARDVSAIVETAYRLENVQALDLFPQTPHVEIVSRLERKE